MSHGNHHSVDEHLIERSLIVLRDSRSQLHWKMSGQIDTDIMCITCSGRRFMRNSLGLYHFPFDLNGGAINFDDILYAGR